MCHEICRQKRTIYEEGFNVPPRLIENEHYASDKKTKSLNPSDGRVHNLCEADDIEFDRACGFEN